MNTTDPIADLLTRIRNALTARHETVNVPVSKMKKAIADILLEEGYVSAVEVVSVKDVSTGKAHDELKITLKYGPDKQNVITNLKRVSKPGLRVYAGCEDLPKVLDGLGYRNNIHVQRRYDRQAGESRQDGRRSARLCVVRRPYVESRKTSIALPEKVSVR